MNADASSKYVRYAPSKNRWGCRERFDHSHCEVAVRHGFYVRQCERGRTNGPRCWQHSTPIAKKTKKKQRKTVAWKMLQRLSFCNSAKLADMFVEIDGRRMEWVGIGWIDVGPAKGDEVLVVEDQA